TGRDVLAWQGLPGGKVDDRPCGKGGQVVEQTHLFLACTCQNEDVLAGGALRQGGYQSFGGIPKLFDQHGLPMLQRLMQLAEIRAVEESSDHQVKRDLASSKASLIFSGDLPPACALLAFPPPPPPITGAIDRIISLALIPLLIRSSLTLMRIWQRS